MTGTATVGDGRQRTFSAADAQTQPAFDALSNRINPSVMTGFGYDSVGNLTSDPTTPANGITYDGENRQTNYTKSGVGTTSYSYDGDGRRVKKITGSPLMTTIYVYDVIRTWGQTA